MHCHVLNLCTKQKPALCCAHPIPYASSELSLSPAQMRPSAKSRSSALRNPTAAWPRRGAVRRRDENRKEEGREEERRRHRKGERTEERPFSVPSHLFPLPHILTHIHTHTPDRTPWGEDICLNLVCGATVTSWDGLAALQISHSFEVSIRE